LKADLVGVCVGYEATIVFNLLIPPEKECMNHEPTATEPALLSLEQDAYFFGCGVFLYDIPRLNLCPRSDQSSRALHHVTKRYYPHQQGEASLPTKDRPISWVCAHQKVRTSSWINQAGLPSEHQTIQPSDFLARGDLPLLPRDDEKSKGKKTKG
jgi:hypothetical protein